MIRNEREYQEAVERLKAEQKRLDEHRASLAAEGLDEGAVKNLMDPMISFHLQLKEEVESYERLKRGEFAELTNLRGLGHLLVSLRIARGISQRDLAKLLDVHESQVSRDERNEYHGISIERATKILEALGVRLKTHVELQPLHAA
jgi:ribosome-binding protein aMBF1 (putative translation factor)